MNKTIKDKVAETLAANVPNIADEIAASLAKDEHNKRVNAAAKVFNNIVEAQRYLSKIDRPDDVKFGANGEKLIEAYTKQRLDEIQKVKKYLAEQDKVLGDAIGPNGALDAAGDGGVVEIGEAEQQRARQRHQQAIDKLYSEAQKPFPYGKGAGQGGGKPEPSAE